VPPDQWLLHNGASSVLGRELIATAKRRGTKLINVVRHREAVAELLQLGCATTLYDHIAHDSQQRVSRLPVLQCKLNEKLACLAFLQTAATRCAPANAAGKGPGLLSGPRQSKPAPASLGTAVRATVRRADEVICSADEDVVHRVMDITGAARRAGSRALGNIALTCRGCLRVHHASASLLAIQERCGARRLARRFLQATRPAASAQCW